jgi:hypothetical protein
MDEGVMEGSTVAQIACGHSHTLMVVTGKTSEELKKFSKFKPKPPKVRQAGGQTAWRGPTDRHNCLLLLPILPRAACSLQRWHITFPLV